MERKTKHRILGIFVVIGFVIILLPFFQGGKEPQSVVGLVKSPEFPDQSVQVSATTQAPVAPVSTPDAAASVQQPQIATATSASNPVNQQPDDTIDTSKSAVNAQAPDMTKSGNVPADAATPASGNAPAITPDKTPAATATPDKAQSSDKTDVSATPADKGKVAELTPAPTIKSADEIAQMSDEVASPKNIDSTSSTDDVAATAKDTHHVVSAEKEEPTIKKVTSANKKIAKLTKHVRNPKIVAAYKKLPIENDGLFKLKNAVWVVQIGSFKNKTNALRLVNQLRTNGYRAFIQQISTTLGDNTRVFIGPETKQTSARELASQVEADMHLHGIVISYKPLTL